MCPFPCARLVEGAKCIHVHSPTVYITLSLSLYFLFNLIQILAYAPTTALPGELILARLTLVAVCLWGMTVSVPAVTSGMQHTVKVSSCTRVKA